MVWRGLLNESNSWRQVCIEMSVSHTSTISAYTLGSGILTKLKQGPIIPELPPLIKQPPNTVDLWQVSVGYLFSRGESGDLHNFLFLLVDCHRGQKACCDHLWPLPGQIQNQGSQHQSWGKPSLFLSFFFVLSVISFFLFYLLSLFFFFFSLSQC